MFTILVMLFFIILGVLFIGALIYVPIAMVFTKPKKCPQCQVEQKFITKAPKCPNCKAKLFKHANGEYMIRN